MAYAAGGRGFISTGKDQVVKLLNSSTHRINTLLTELRGMDISAIKQFN